MSTKNRLSVIMAMMLSCLLVKLSWETLLLHREITRKQMLLQIVVTSHEAAAASKSSVTASFATVDRYILPADFVTPPVVNHPPPMVEMMADDNVTMTMLPGSNHELVLFYHIYLPNQDDANNSLSIVAEQLHQIGQSTALQALQQQQRQGGNGSEATMQLLPVYYNTIGNRTLDAGFMQRLCTANRLSCHHLHHYTQGFEFYTLQDARRHCRQVTTTTPTSSSTTTTATTSPTVMYMHNKGSFHAQKTGAAPLRRSLTMAISSRQCHQALHQDTCNVCGLAFSPWKSGPFFPGNFWMAQCAYVRQLLDPFAFREMTFETQKAARHMHRRGKLTFDLFPRLPSVWGTGRYAAEYWVGSHPTIRPCDVTSIRTLRTFERRNLTLDDIHLQTSPREPYTREELVVKIPSTVEGRIHEYFLMAGYIMRWRRYYHAVADDSSWVWKYFPEGTLWKRAVQDHGMREGVFQMLNNDTYLQSLLQLQQHDQLDTNGTHAAITNASSQ